MRVLLSTQAGSGHWHPLAPLAAVLAAAGHEVAFATAPGTCPAIARHGFQCFPAGAEADAPLNLSPAEFEAMPSAWVWANLFVERRAARCLPDLIDLCRRWRPDLIVRDLTEFAAAIAAERLDIPHAVVQVGAWRPALHASIAGPLNQLRQGTGLAPDPELDTLYRYLLLTPMPRGYQDSASPLPPTAHPVRYVPFDQLAPGPETLPRWVDELTELPVVYATLGTAFNRNLALFTAIVEAFRDEPVNLIVTTGVGGAAVAAGEGAPRVRIEPYVPQSVIFPRCDLVVTHGGFNTVFTALDHGLPLVMLPIAANMPENGRRCAELGVAKVIGRENRTPEAIRQAGRDILGDNQFRRRAEHLRDEMHGMPGVEHAVALLERLAIERRPLLPSGR